MPCRTKKTLKILLLLLLPVVFFSCEEKQPSPILYRKPVEKPQEATATWLSKSKHFHEEGYMPVFYTYYQSKIKSSNYAAAAEMLATVSLKKMYFSVYDQRFTDTVISFSEKYRSKLPVAKTAFIDSYIGSNNMEQGNFRTAIQYNQKITRIPVTNYQSCNDVAYAYFDIAFCYFSIGEQNLAQKNSFKSLEYFNKTDSYSGKGVVYSNLGSINMATKNYKKSEEYYDKAITYFTIEKDTGNVLNGMYNKIHIYDESNNKKLYQYIDHTYNYLQKSKYNDLSIKISIYTYYTKKLLHEGRIAQAKQTLDEIKPDVLALDSPTSTQEYDIAMAEYEIRNNNRIPDVNVIKNAIPALKEKENYQLILTYYDLLKQDALAKKDYENAMAYEEELRKASDSIGSNEMRNKVIELDKKYQVAKKEQQIELQKKTIFSKNTTIALLLSVLMAFFLSVVIISTLQKQKKLKLEKANAQLYTKQLLEKTEEERKRIASDLHDSVSHELLGLKNAPVEKTAAFNQKIDAIINDIRSISRNLHPVMFEKIGLKASVEQLVERAQSVNDFMVTSDIDYARALLQPSEELQLYRIIQESLSNIIKYSGAMAAKITIAEKSNALHIEIKDNGKGFDVAHTLSQGNAFGLHNIIQRSRAIGGEAKITSSGNGTIISIEIKKAT